MGGGEYTESGRRGVYREWEKGSIQRVEVSKRAGGGGEYTEIGSKLERGRGEYTESGG